MDKISIFNTLFQNDGGIVNHNKYEFYGELLPLFHDMVKRLKLSHPETPDIYVNFIENFSLNAKVTKYNETYYIGINVGTFHLLSDTFAKILSTKYLLSNIGNPENESDVSLKINADSPYPGVLRWYMDPQNYISPKNSIRKSASRFLTLIALEFLLLHECGHILRGHVGYMLNFNNQNEFNELNYSSDNMLMSNISQTLEMDADSFAIHRILNHFGMIAEGEIEYKIEFHQFLTSWPIIAAHCSFAIYTLFRLFGFYQYPVNEAKEKSHPPAAIRMRMLHMTIYAKLSKWPFINIDAVMQSVNSAIMEAEESVVNVTYYESNWNSWANAYSKENAKYIDEIYLNWAIVRPLLEDYAIIDLPPIVNNQQT